MMKKHVLLFALAISGSGLAAVPLRPAVVQMVSVCEPGFCQPPVQAGNELAQGIGGVARQASRVLEPATAGTLADPTE